jgi:hypothetical protein
MGGASGIRCGVAGGTLLASTSLSLTPGTRIGVYEIIAPIGEAWRLKQRSGFALRPTDLTHMPSGCDAGSR